MTFRRNIIRLRKEHGLTQEGLADKLGISRQSVQKWESGESMPDLDRISSLAKLFGVGVDDLVSGDAANSIDPAKTQKKKQTAIRFIFFAILVAVVGLVLIFFKDTAITRKTDISHDDAQQMIDMTRENEADDEIFFISDSWDTAYGEFCVFFRGDQPTICFRKKSGDSQMITMERIEQRPELFITLSALAFVVSAYITAYAIIRYKLNRFVWHVTQICIFVLLFTIMVTATIVEANTSKFYVDVSGGVLFSAIIMLLGISYPAISILVLGKRNLKKQ